MNGVDSQHVDLRIVYFKISDPLCLVRRRPHGTRWCSPHRCCKSLGKQEEAVKALSRCHVNCFIMTKVCKSTALIFVERSGLIVDILLAGSQFSCDILLCLINYTPDDSRAINGEEEREKTSYFSTAINCCRALRILKPNSNINLFRPPRRLRWTWGALPHKFFIIIGHTSYNN